MDRLSDYLYNLNLRDKRNIISSIAAGSLFAIGWWVGIDAMCAYPSNQDLLKASHACAGLASLALIMINSVTNSQVRGESMYSEFFMGKTGARIWVFVAFLMSFGSLIGAFWIFFDYYVSKDRNILPGVSILIQNIFIFASALIFKFGRCEDLWQ